MKVLIEASNITNGGGLTHLVNLINNFNPNQHTDMVLNVFAPARTLDKLINQPWLKKHNVHLLNSNLSKRLFWRIFIFPKSMKKINPDVIFAPGGLYIGNTSKVVLMSQNMLIFEKKERKRFDLFSWSRFRLKTLNIIQSFIFRNSKGLIFISNYAKDYITRQLQISDDYPVIYHGIEKRFFRKPKIQLPISEYSFDNPFKLLYTSIVDVYKHQWVLVEACSILRKDGLPVELHLVGGAYPPALKKLSQSIKKHDSEGNFVFYHGKVEFEIMESIYSEADGFIFASTCENMPNIVVEAMASGLPILCSNHGPMPEIIGDKILTFDPTNLKSVTEAIRIFITDYNSRRDFSELLFKKASDFSWEKCAESTFNYLQNKSLEIN